MKTFQMNCGMLLLLSMALRIFTYPFTGPPFVIMSPQGVGGLIGSALALVLIPALLTLGVGFVAAKVRSKPLNPSKVLLWLLWYIFLMMGTLGELIDRAP